MLLAYQFFLYGVWLNSVGFALCSWTLWTFPWLVFSESLGSVRGPSVIREAEEIVEEYLSQKGG